MQRAERNNSGFTVNNFNLYYIYSTAFDVSPSVPTARQQPQAHPMIGSNKCPREFPRSGDRVTLRDALGEVPAEGAGRVPLGHGGCSPRAFRYRWRFALAFRAEVHVDVEVVLVLECELRKVRFVILCAKPRIKFIPIA